MTWRPTWPEVLALVEELRFQVTVVALVVVIGALAVAITLPRSGSTSASSPPAARDEVASRLAGPEPTAGDAGAAASDGTSTAAAASTAAVTPSVSALAPVVRSAPRPPAPTVGERARLITPVPTRLACTDEQAPLGVLLGGTDVDIIAVGTADCAGWVLAQSPDGLTWLHPSSLVPIEGTPSTAP